MYYDEILIYFTKFDIKVFDLLSMLFEMCCDNLWRFLYQLNLWILKLKLLL